MTKGQLIKQLRKKLKLTQPEFAKKVSSHLTQSALSQIENDKAPVTIETLCKIVETFGRDALPLLISQCSECCVIETARLVLNMPEHDTRPVHKLQKDVNRRIHALSSIAAENPATPEEKTANFIKIQDITRDLIQDIQLFATIYRDNK